MCMDYNHGNGYNGNKWIDVLRPLLAMYFSHFYER